MVDVAQRVKDISYMLGKEATPNGQAYNWLGVMRDGTKISLYYNINRSEEDLGFIEAMDPHKKLGLSTDGWHVVLFPIMDIPKYFVRYGV